MFGGPDSEALDLKLLPLNAKSVINKTHIIWDLILDEDADLVYYMETWFDEAVGVNLSQLCLPGFMILQKP